MTTSSPELDTTSLAARLTELADADPDATAITCGEVSLTRGQLERSANRLARSYSEMGVTPGSFVTIGLPNSVEFIAAALAVWKCGAIPQPISSRLPDHEAGAIIRLVQPTLAIGVSREVTTDHPVVPANFQPEMSISDAPYGLPPASEWKAPASGGSTGRPKIIVSTEPATAATLSGLAEILRMQHGDTALITAPLFHNSPFAHTFCVLALGGHVVLMPKFDALEALNSIRRHRVQWAYMVPTMMSRIHRVRQAGLDDLDVSSLRVVMHMAAPCPEWLKIAWIDWLGADRIWELYGGTEAQALTVVGGAEWLEHPGTVGRTVVGEMSVCDENHDVLPPGETGEIWMRRGPGEPNPYRYIGAEPTRFGDGWETLGDIGRMDSDGYVFLADRRADMINVGGANVFPAEVEGAILEHPGVRSTVVVGVDHADLGQVPHAFVEVDGSLPWDELCQFLETRISRHKIPRSFERADGPLRDDAGKVRRSALLVDVANPGVDAH